MKESDQDNQAPSFGLKDFAFIIFRHKWIICGCTLLGVLLAAATHFFLPPPYQSESKLLVRYVLDRSVVDPQESQVKLPDSGYNENLIAAEKDILSSWDLATQVAQSLANEGMIPSRKPDLDQAARRFSRGLTVSGSKGSNVLTVSYKDPDPLRAQHSLESLISSYFVKHLEVHRSTNVFNYVSKETDEVENRLKQIDSELRAAKAATGIISLKVSTDNMDAEIAKSREALNTAEQETTAQRARVKELEKLLGSTEPERPATAGFQGSRKDLRAYQNLVLGVNVLRQRQYDLLSRFTPQSPMAKSTQAQITALEDQQRELEKKFPAMIGPAQEGANRFSLIERNPQLDLIAEQANLAALEQKTGALKEQFQDLEDRVKHFTAMAPEIGKLERQKELEETNYKYFKESLDKARIDEALDPTKIPNISIVQKPTPPLRATKGRSKVLLGLSGGGLFVGIALAAMLEMYFNRNLKRPVELERLNIPCLLTIPYLSNGKSFSKSAGEEPKSSFAQPERPYGEGGSTAEEIGAYAEALRDRLDLEFQLKHMTRKPKLVAITSCANGAGVSTIAAALASAFSQTGKVLLVNMTADDQAHPRRLRSAPACSLPDAIHPDKHKSMNGANLCFADAKPSGSVSPPISPKKFYELMPQLRETDFECIIFDMPPLEPTSSTLAMVAFMDKVILVVEAESTPRDSLHSAYSELIAAKTDVSALFNQSRSYGPKWIN